MNVIPTIPGPALHDRAGPLGGLAVPRSQPYPWPYDQAAEADHTALLIVAAQAGLAPMCPAAAEALAVIEVLASAVRDWGGVVVRTRHARSPAHDRPSVLAPVGALSWELLAPGPDGPSRPGDLVVDAFGMDGFAGSPLAERLAGAGIDHLLVCGLGLEGPVHSTLRSANDRGIECLLVIDACAAANPTLTESAVRIVEMSGGIFGAVATSEDVLRALRFSESDTSRSTL